MRRVRKKTVKLDHEQKRQLARQLANGAHAKQLAVAWNVSLDAVHKVAQEYLIVFRVEKYPLDNADPHKILWHFNSSQLRTHTRLAARR